LLIAESVSDAVAKTAKANSADDTAKIQVLFISIHPLPSNISGDIKDFFLSNSLT